MIASTVLLFGYIFAIKHMTEHCGLLEKNKNMREIEAV